MANKVFIIEKTTGLLKKYNIYLPPVEISVIVKGEGLHIDEQDFGESVSGLLVSNNARRIIGINKTETYNRKRFTLAHELGHYVLHRHSELEEYISINKVDFRNSVSSTGEVKKEREANSFAANILMPEFMIKDEVARLEKNISVEDAIERLANTFQVSEAAMTYRLINLKYIYG